MTDQDQDTGRREVERHHVRREDGETLPERLEAAIRGLVYSSEDDAPFTVIQWIGAGRNGVPDAATIAEFVGASDDDRIEERPLDEFLAHHTERSDAHDVRAQRIRPRYEALEAMLRSELRDARFIRIGRNLIRCVVVGADGAGNLTGVETVAVET